MDRCGSGAGTGGPANSLPLVPVIRINKQGLSAGISRRGGVGWDERMGVFPGEAGMSLPMRDREWDLHHLPVPKI